MPQDTNTDIQELKDLIQGLDRKMEKGFSSADSKMDLGFSNADRKMEVGFAKLEGKIDNLDSRLSNLESTAAKLPDLAEKVGELKNWKQIAIVVFTASVSGAIAWSLCIERSWGSRDELTVDIGCSSLRAGWGLERV